MYYQDNPFLVDLLTTIIGILTIVWLVMIIRNGSLALAVVPVILFCIAMFIPFLNIIVFLVLLFMGILTCPWGFVIIPILCSGAVMAAALEGSGDSRAFMALGLTAAAVVGMIFFVTLMRSRGQLSVSGVMAVLDGITLVFPGVNIISFIVQKFMGVLSCSWLYILAPVAATVGGGIASVLTNP